jgi:hypothetical protein
MRADLSRQHARRGRTVLCYVLRFSFKHKLFLAVLYMSKVLKFRISIIFCSTDDLYPISGRSSILALNMKMAEA